jgi:hypothetical protein
MNAHKSESLKEQFSMTTGLQANTAITSTFKLVISESKVVLCYVNHQAVKMCGGVELELHAFLTLTLDGGQFSAVQSFRYTL